LEVLRHCLPASIRQTLDRLPKSLDDTYLRVLKQIPQVNQAHAHRMLQCLVVAIRPLRVEELAELLAFEFDAAQGGIPKYLPALRLDDQTHAVLSTCSSLVTITVAPRSLSFRYIVHSGLQARPKSRMPTEASREKTVQFVQFSHFSVKEFLVSNRLASSLGDISRYQISLGSAHTILMQACLGLLLHSDNRNTKESVEHSPLAGYAARYWVEHAQFKDVASRVKEGIETLFDLDKPHFVAWVGIYNIDPRVAGTSMWHTSEIPTPLYYSVLCGFYDLVEHLAIKNPHHVNAFGGQYKFPLLAALSRGHAEVTELLLKHDADVDIREVTEMTMKLGVEADRRDEANETPLYLTIRKNRFRLAEILLEHGADANAENNKVMTPLHVLPESQIKDEGDIINLALLLLKHGAKVNRQDKDNETPLHRAIRWDRFMLAGLLLEHGADANAESSRGTTPLHILSESRIKEEGIILNLASSLLKNGAEVNRRDKNNEIPLHLAIRWDRFMLAGTLLENGADTNAENNEGKAPIHILSESAINDEGDIFNLVLLLSKNGAEVNKRDNDHNTPFHLAIRRNHFKLAWALLKHGADAIAENNKGQTPLHILSQSQYYDEGIIINLALTLLKSGAEVNRRDNDNETPFHLAIRRNRFKLVWAFLEHGADAIADNNKGQTPLHILSQSQFYDEGDIHNLALTLLKNGAEVNRRDKVNETPFHLAIQRNRFKLAWAFLEHGADAIAENYKGQTALHMLSQCRFYDEIDILNLALTLMKNGAEVNRRDKDNETPFHLAIRRNRFKLAWAFLEHGADTIAENSKGESPLHILSQSQFHDSDIHNLALSLLKNGAEVNRLDEHNQTPLHLAIQRNKFQLAGILLEHGADANAENNERKTPLCKLSDRWSYGEGELVHRARLALVRGVGVNRQDEDNRTLSLLKLRIGEGVREVTEILIELIADASVDSENNMGKTSTLKYNLGPFQIAVLLLYYGATYNIGEDGGEAPICPEIEGEYYIQSGIGITGFNESVMC
jgi:ankyrin repeat protein